MTLKIPGIARLSDPQLYLETNADKLVCNDEIQLLPDLFPILRTENDRDRRPGCFLTMCAHLDGQLLNSAKLESSLDLSGPAIRPRLKFLQEALLSLPGWHPSIYRSAGGAELDLVLERGTSRLAFEFKASSAPAPTKGFYAAIADLAPERTFLVGLAEGQYPIARGVAVCGLREAAAAALYQDGVQASAPDKGSL